MGPGAWKEEEESSTKRTQKSTSLSILSDSHPARREFLLIFSRGCIRSTERGRRKNKGIVSEEKSEGRREEECVFCLRFLCVCSPVLFFLSLSFMAEQMCNSPLSSSLR